MKPIIPLLSLAISTAWALPPSEITITADPAVTVDIKRRLTDASKTIYLTINKSDKVTVTRPHHAYPFIDLTLIPPPNIGYAVPRVRSVWRDSTTGADCVQGAPNCAIPPVLIPAGPHTVGAFRTVCGFAKMAKDDPIVYPGQTGAAHLHTFIGNTSVDAFSTVDSIANKGNSTCAGGTLNRSSYWFPAMIDTGRPLVPASSVVYYKGHYEFDSSAVVQPMPHGLRMVSKGAKNTDPATTGARYVCYGANGELPTWKNTITQAVADGTCKVGGDFVMMAVFPFCWDGVNLDSPDHASHLSAVVQDGTAPFAKHCPTTHPVVLPAISYNIHYTIPDDQAVSRWRLSSDMDAMLPAGISGHADYFIGWDTDILQTWVTKCLKARMDCHADLLGDGRTLY